MIKKESREVIREKKHLKIRNRFSGTTERPRLNIKCGHKHIYAQVIDDSKGFTLAAASTLSAEIKGSDEYKRYEITEN